MERLVAARRPHPERKAPEVEEVLADAYARLAELRLKKGELDPAGAAVKSGLEHVAEATYFRGHLVEVQGLIEEARAAQLADAGNAAEAARAREHAIQLLEEVVKIQEQVIQRSLAQGRGLSMQANPRSSGGGRLTRITLVAGVLALASGCATAKQAPSSPAAPSAAGGTASAGYPPGAAAQSQPSYAPPPPPPSPERRPCDAAEPGTAGRRRGSAATARSMALQTRVERGRVLAARARRRRRRLPQRLSCARLDGPRRRPPLRALRRARDEGHRCDDAKQRVYSARDRVKHHVRAAARTRPERGAQPRPSPRCADSSSHECRSA